MTTIRVNPRATISIDGGPALPISGGTITEDRAWSPYIQGTLVLDEFHGTIPDPRVPDRRDVRCVVTLTDETGSETFGLSLRRVERDKRTGRVTLRVATDEAIMARYVKMHATLLMSVADLRNVCNNVVADVLYGFFPMTPIEPSPLTADITPRYELTNWMMNPSVVGSLGTYFSVASGTSAIDYSTAVGGYVGTSAVRWTASGTGASMLSIRSYTVTEGQQIEASCYVRSPGSRNYRFRFRWYDADGDLIIEKIGTSFGATNAWNPTARPQFRMTAPKNAAKVGIIVERISGTAGEFSYADAFMVYEVTPDAELENVEYFDGSTTSTGYTTAWEDGAHTSQSTRIPIVERPPEGQYWETGTSAWDYLSSLCSANGFRLFQDRDEKWWLVNDLWSILMAPLVITDANTTDRSEVIDIDEPNGGLTGVAVQYIWNNAKSDGIRKERWDWAGTPKRGRVVRYERPFPGPGAAAHILATRQVDGETLEPITTDMKITARVGAPLELAWSSDDYSIAAITWDLGAWQMTVRPRRE